MNPSEAHQRPPEILQSVYKKYRTQSGVSLVDDPNIVDLLRDSDAIGRGGLRVVRTISSALLQNEFSRFSASTSRISPPLPVINVYEHDLLPGLHVIPSLLPAEIQWILLDRLLHRDLADPRHKTNVHMHYDIPYDLIREQHDAQSALALPTVWTKEPSFFGCVPKSRNVVGPLVPDTHKPINMSQFLNKKLRWMTLGGQYDWTRKVYPDEIPPTFPEDIGHLIRGLFPDITPEAAIVNLYSPGDTLSLHRDVSEQSSQGLVSISLGCDGLFVVGLEGEAENDRAKCLTIRLRSGDAVYMSGAARYAWHGVPQIIPGTCPTWLEPWPAPASLSAPLKQPDMAGVDNRIDPSFAVWRGWMSTKRINLNVRQMNDR